MDWKVYLGKNTDNIKLLDDKSVQTVITSPPYFRLRQYGDSDDEIGTEETPEEFIETLCQVFDEIKPKLKDDGTLWVNLGDTYASNVSEGVKKFGSADFQAERPGRQNVAQPGRKLTGDLKKKDLIGIPWMFAFAMRKRGWYLRQEIIWSKPNPMPESCTDRCTKSHEHIFLLAKNESYLFDHEFIREVSDSFNPEKKNKRIKTKDVITFDFESDTTKSDEDIKAEKLKNKEIEDKSWSPDGFRNKRSVWEVPTSGGEIGTDNEHVATYPEALVSPGVLAGTKEGDIVMDPFNGSGTTGVVALKLGRKYVGFELYQSFEKTYTRRLNEAQSIIDSQREVEKQLGK
jgi:DNA modification methylase